MILGQGFICCHFHTTTFQGASGYQVHPLKFGSEAKTPADKMLLNILKHNFDGVIANEQNMLDMRQTQRRMLLLVLILCIDFDRITCKHNESAQEWRIALYKQLSINQSK